MFVEKIKKGESGLLMYSITPPKLGASAEKMLDVAQKTKERIRHMDIDALIIYDVQDETHRTQEERPFPFSPAHDPYVYTQQYLGDVTIPKVIYRPAGKYDKEELESWLRQIHDIGAYPIFVGVPAPDYIPKMNLADAYRLWQPFEERSVIGAISIPERHQILGDEDIRMIDKVKHGVQYFVTQCVFDVDYSVKMLDALQKSCLYHHIPVPTMIFTLSTCGSKKTLHFMEWLGIHFSENHKSSLLLAEDILSESVGLCLQMAQQLADFCIDRGIPYGFNIESVAVKKEEVEASLRLMGQVRELLNLKAITQ